MPVPFDSNYLVYGYGLDEGFPGNSCTGIAQTPNGYLWFSSFSGVARFNGREFTAFTRENLPALLDSRAVNCFTDRRGRLFISTLRGLAMKSEQGWTNYPEASAWPEQELIRSHAEVANGEVYIGTTKGRIFSVGENTLQALPPLPGKGGVYCAADTDGNLFAVRGDFLGSWNGSRWTNFSEVPNALPRTVGLGQARNGGVWLVMTNALALIRNGRVEREVTLSESVGSFWELLEDREGNVWLPSFERGIYRIATNGIVHRLTKADGLPSDAGTRAVFEDNRGGIWIGSGAGGVVRLRPARFHSLASGNGLPDVAATSVTSLPDGRIVVGTYGGGLNVFDGRRVKKLTELPTKFIQTVAADDRGSLFAGTADGGLFRTSDELMFHLNDRQPKLPTKINALLFDS